MSAAMVRHVSRMRGSTLSGMVPSTGASVISATERLSRGRTRVSPPTRTASVTTAAYLALICIFIVGCGASPASVVPAASVSAAAIASPTATTRPRVTARPTPVPTPTPSPSPTPGPHRVGQTARFSVGGDVGNAFYLTIKAVKPWSQKYNDPDPGMKYVIVDVLLEGMAGETEVSPLEFTITDADGYVYEITGMHKEPSLPYDIALTVGKKVRGWLTFEIAKTLKAGSVAFADSTFTFTLP